MERPHPYRAFLHRLERPARYLGAEHGVIRKPWEEVRTRFCMAFPDTYELGMSHLGLKVLYETLGREPDMSCERVFAPWGDLEAELRARGLPLVSLESARPLAEFHVVGFSLQFELTFTTVLAMLELGGIPLRAADRREGDPLVIGGGPVASHAEPMAPFFDLFLLGDAERALPELLRQDAELRGRGAARPERVASLGGRPEIYAPALAAARVDQATGRVVVGEPSRPQATRKIEWDLSGLVDTGGGPVPSIEAVFDRAALEVARGCNQGCRFCQAGFLYRPLRERPADALLAALSRRAAEGGYDEVSLTALSTADYSALGPLLRGAAAALAPRNVSISVSSLRAIGLDGALLDDLRTGRAGSLTFAPEAGSQRMRDRINKRISEEGLLTTARRVAARGWSHLKLYFMIGLPGEEDEDVMAILDLAERVRRAAREEVPRRAPRVTMAVNNFVPKPHTPMQWCRMEGAAELYRRQGLLRAHPLAQRLGLRLHDVPMSLLEGQLARGDRTLAAVIEGAYRDGARFDGWEDHFVASRWERAFRAEGQDPTFWLQALPRGGRLPWDHLDIAVEPAFLEHEHEKMEAGRPGPPCGVPPLRSKKAESSGAGPGSDGAPVPDVAEESPRDETLHVACLRCGLPCLEQPPRRAGEEMPSLGQEPSGTPRQAGPAKVVHLDEPSAGRDLPAPAPGSRVAAPVGRRLRLVYAKQGPAAYLSHLDLVRQLPRILRRAGLQPTYSQGFNPHPKLQLTPPLPLGAQAQADALDVWIALAEGEEPSPAQVLARLDAGTLPGLTFHGARWLGDDEPALGKQSERALYRFEPAGGWVLADVQARARAVVEQPAFTVVRMAKGKSAGRRDAPPRDLRASLEELRVDAGPSGRIAVFFRLSQRPEGTLRPRELLEALLGRPDPEGTLVRIHHLHTDASGALAILSA